MHLRIDDDDDDDKEDGNEIRTAKKKSDNPDERIKKRMKTFALFRFLEYVWPTKRTSARKKKKNGYNSLTLIRNG